MFAIVDLEGMMFVRAHMNQRLLSSIDKIELAHIATSIMEATDPESYNGFTDTEVKSLYRATFGFDSFFRRAQTVKVLCDNAHDMPQVDADPYEALLQANSIGEDDDGPYKYVKGAHRPLPLDEELTTYGIRLKHVPLGETPAPKAPPSPGNGPAAASVPSAAPTPPANGSDPAQPLVPLPWA